MLFVLEGDGGGERVVKEKLLYIINKNLGFAIDSFFWDFSGELISVGCWGGFVYINFYVDVYSRYIFFRWNNKVFVNEV